jgi:hypothetical protein
VADRRPWAIEVVDDVGGVPGDAGP